MKAVATGSNKGGKRFAIIRRAAGFVVVAQSHNYSHGKTVSAWRVCAASTKQSNFDFQIMAKEGLSLDSAIALFNKKVVKEDRVTEAA